MEKNLTLKLIAILAILFIVIMTVSVYAAQIVNDRIEIDNDNITLDNGDLFGYQIEAIGDLDADGVIDLATIKFSDDSNEANVGSILILFMNADGSVKGTNEIVMDGTANGLNGCIANDSTNRDNGSLEQLAFVGDLDGDGLPTLALGANSNDHPIANSGAVYMLELNSNGTVDNCLLITEDSNGFDPAIGVYRQSGEGQAANFGWPVIATDLNGDGQNELIVGATSNDDNFTDLWVLFLTSTGAVSSHPATPISGQNDIRIDTGEYLSDGVSISGTKIVVSNENDGDGGGSIFIVNLSTSGAFVSVTEIAGSTIPGVANDERFGSGVAPLGDMDGDGINDIIVGNEAGDDTNSLSGEVHILYLNADDTLKESQKISNESENTRNSLTPFAASDLFGHGMALWIDSAGSAVIAISATQDDTGAANSGAIHLFSITRASSGGGGGDNGAKTKPTFGLDHNTFNPLVEGGFSFNGVSHDITDNWWTPFNEQEVKIGTLNTFTSKVYTDKGLRVQEFLFGIPTVGDAHKAELGVEIWYDSSGEIEAIKAVQKTNVIDVDSIKVIPSMSKCTSEDEDERCYTTTLSMKFLEPLQDKIMALKAIDYNGRTHITYLNEGFDITGVSLNPMITMMIHGTQKYEGLVEITQTAKYSDVWSTNDGRDFEINSYGSANQINQSFEINPELVEKRFSSDFSNYKKSLIEKYTELLLETCPDCFTSFADFEDSWSYDIINEVDRIEKIAHLIELEQQRATQVLVDAELAITYPDYIINTDDRPISVILAEERIMKKILSDERSYLKQVLSTQN